MKHELSYKWADYLNDNRVDEIIRIINSKTNISMTPVVHRKLDNTVKYYELLSACNSWALNSKDDLLRVVVSRLAWLNAAVNYGLIVRET